MKKNRLYQSKCDRIVMFFVYFFLILALIIVLVPLLNIVASSFSSPDAVTRGEVFLLPVEFTTMAYKAVLKYRDILIGFRNSLFYALTGTAVSLSLTMLAAYPLAKRGFPLKRLVMVILTITMLFNGGMIPTYLIVKKLKLIDSFWAMILPGAVNVWNIIVTRTYIQGSIPDTLQEAAALDGCDDWRFFLRVVLPLSVPVIAVNGLMFAVGHWNAYFNALLYLNDSSKYPLQLFLRNILIQNQFDISMIGSVDVVTQAARQNLASLLKYAVIVVSSVPVLILYPFIQKYFIKGMLVGSIKG